jgi:hypothetical protein
MSDDYTVDEVPTASELMAAAAVEARSLADEVDAGARKRLLVLAHTTQLLARELASAETPTADGRFAARQLAAAIRAGEHDHELSAILARVRSEVRPRVEISAPGYAD